MKKAWFILPLFLLLAGLRLAAAPVTITGYVTLNTDDSAVPDWMVFINGFDPAGNTGAYAFTDANGFYSVTVDLPDGTSEVQVQTFDNCSGVLLVNATVTNGSATADFSICGDMPPPDTSCVAYVNYWPNPADPLSVSFYGEAFGGTGFTYTWDFGDNTTATGQEVTHTYAEAGTYTVTLNVSSPECNSTAWAIVTVPGFYTGPTVEVTVSGQVTYTTSGAPAAGWWVQANGANPFQSYDAFTDANGNYEMIVDVPDTATTVFVQTFDVCSGILVEFAPIVNGGATANFQICPDSFPPPPGCQVYFYYTNNNTSGLTYQFQAQVFTADPADVIATYAWDFGDGATSTEASPSHTYGQDGVYTVTLTITTATGCVAYACDVVCTLGGGVIDTFYYGCQAMFGVGWGLDPGNPAGANPYELSFFDLSFGAVQSWAWDFGDGSTSTESNPVHTYAEAGLYTVTLHIETIDGCESDIAMQVYVGDYYPWSEYDCQAMFIPIPDSTGNGFYFLDLSITPDSIQSWHWDFGDNTTSDEQNPFHAYNQPGVYTVTLTIEGDSCSSMISFELDTNNPFFRFTGTGGVMGVAAGATETTEAPVFDSARLFPNPTVNDIALSFDSRVSGRFDLVVSDLSGRELLHQNREVNAGANALRVPVSEFKPGLYLLQLRSADQMQTLKFTKL